MKGLVACLITWIFIVPCAIAICLIFGFLGAFMLNLYLALAGLLVTLVIMWGPLWIPQSSRERFRMGHTNDS